MTVSKRLMASIYKKLSKMKLRIIVSDHSPAWKSRRRSETLDGSMENLSQMR